MFAAAQLARSAPSRTARWARLLLLTPMLGCVSNLQPLDVTGFSPISTDANGACTTVASSTAGLALGQIDSGIADVLNPDQNSSGPQLGYVVGVTVRSQLQVNNTQPTATAGIPPVRVDGHTARLDTATVKYKWSPAAGSGPFTTQEATFPVAAIIEPTGTASFPVTILDGTHGAELKGQTGTLAAEITFSGTLEDGSSISATPATFSISVAPGLIASTLADAQKVCAGATPVTICGPNSGSQPDGLVCPKTAM